MSPDEQRLRAVCVCGGIGFPSGTASAKRVLLIGRGLVEAGVDYEVWHLGPSLVETNTERRGVAGGVAYSYLSPTVRRPAGPLGRILCQAWGFALLPLKIAGLSRRAIVHVYYQGCVWNAWTLAWCRLFGVRTVQEACEWWPTTEYRTRFNAFMFHRIMFRWSSGALAISRDIERKIRECSGREYPVIRIPVLSEAATTVAHAEAAGRSCDGGPTVIWCGELGGYGRDIRFMIDVVARLPREGSRRVRLVLCGPKTSDCEQAYRAYARDAGLSEDQLELPGFISEAELLARCGAAVAALMPMWLDSRSLTRFPTKTGLYASTGTPIVTVGVGEVAQFLRDGHSAVFYSADDPVDCAKRIGELISDPERAARIGRTGRNEVMAALDYRAQGRSLRDWLRSLDRTGVPEPVRAEAASAAPVPASKADGQV